MGNYNEQYESYYNAMLKKKNRNGYEYNYKKSNNFAQSESNFWIRRITVDLIGVFVLFSLVIFCKCVVNPQTTAAYNFSKEIVNKNYDYSTILQRAKEIKIQDLENYITIYLEKIKVKIDGQKILKDRISSEFVLPVEGTLASGFGETIDPVTQKKSFHDGIDIEVAENTEVKASGDGKVKECGENKELGKYIIIDHGNGVETKYGHLSGIGVHKDEAVQKSMVIGKSGNTGVSSAPHLYFEISYMGESKDPGQYFSMLKK